MAKEDILGDEYQQKLLLANVWISSLSIDFILLSEEVAEWFVFETGSCYIGQVGLKLAIFPPLSPQF